MTEPTSRRRFLQASAVGVTFLAAPTLARAEFLLSRKTVERQPFAAQVRRLIAALGQVGAPLQAEDLRALDNALALADDAAAIAGATRILDRYSLLTLEINPEGRVAVVAAKGRSGPLPELVEQGWRVFLLKVLNNGAVTAPLTADSPQARMVSMRLPGASLPAAGTVVAPREATRPAASTITTNDIADRWFDVETFDEPPLSPTLSGLSIEYRIAQLYSRDRGQREATLQFATGPGSGDLGDRSKASILFRCVPSTTIMLDIRDVDGAPTMASLIVRDALGRVYPLRGKRLAPDFPFQAQVYRADGETLTLPAGEYSVQVGRGPEYFQTHRTLTVAKGSTSQTERIQLARWIDPAEQGWYSGDHHIHAAGCRHYNSPTEGVDPTVIARHVRGEGLRVGEVLSWAPSWYHQKQHFSGQVDPASSRDTVLRYDVEVSGFPSSHTGHLVLLGLREQDFPGTQRLEDWPTWSLPILRWAKRQGAVVGFAHTGHGLEVETSQLPNFEVPPFDNNGANEYLVDVTHEVDGEPVVDILSVADSSVMAELNIWYHSLNCGFRTRIGGESDFPCVIETVGIGRSYVRLDAPPSGEAGYRAWLAGLRAGRAYASDGRAHIMDLQVQGVPVGTGGGGPALGAPEAVRVTARVGAWLDEGGSAAGDRIRALPPTSVPCWHVERARIPRSRTVSLELIVNGVATGRQAIVADGIVRDVAFDVRIEKSSWIALRILAAAHTNPIFVTVGGRPIRASRESAEWCLRSVDRSWEKQSPRIDQSVRAEAAAAYDHARDTYSQRLRDAE